jgi:hypothetical protein
LKIHPQYTTFTAGKLKILNFLLKIVNLTIFTFRCCFLIFPPNETKFKLDAKTIKMLKYVLESSQSFRTGSPWICSNCINSLEVFYNFKTAVNIRQNNFNDLEEANLIDNLNEIRKLNDENPIKDEIEVEEPIVTEQIFVAPFEPIKEEISSTNPIKKITKPPPKILPAPKIKFNESQPLPFRSRLTTALLKQVGSHIREKKPCKLCHKVFFDLKSHREKVHFAKSQFKCPKCEFMAKDQNDVKNHHAEVHKSDNLMPKFDIKRVMEAKCYKCDFKTYNMEELKKHQYHQHKKIEIKERREKNEM